MLNNNLSQEDILGSLKTYIYTINRTFMAKNYI